MKPRHRDSPGVGALTRRALLGAGTLVVGFRLARAEAATARAAAASGAGQRDLPLDAVDSFIAIRGDGTVVVYCGKVDLGTGHRIAIRRTRPGP